MDQPDQSRLYTLGCRISAWASDAAAHPYVQFGVILFCLGWFAIGLDTNLLTAALSILAISLTQMVLNRQNEREREAHVRDVAMHAKLDELLVAGKRSHNEIAGIEDLPEEQIEQVKSRIRKRGRASPPVSPPELPSEVLG